MPKKENTSTEQEDILERVFSPLDKAASDIKELLINSLLVTPAHAGIQ